MMKLLLLLFVVFCVSISDAKYETGSVVTNEKWVFITRFCFLSQDGQFEYSIQYEKSYAPQNLLLYYDSDTQWPAVYKSNKTCQQKEGVLSRRLNQIIPLDPSDFGSGCQERKVNASTIISCHQARRFHSSRERWWFLAVSNCNSTKGLNLEFRFLMTNGPSGDYWHEHFSADEFFCGMLINMVCGLFVFSYNNPKFFQHETLLLLTHIGTIHPLEIDILPVLMAFCVVYMLLVLSVIMCSMELKSRQLLHSTYKLFALSVYLQQIGIFLQIVAYIRYASDGIGIHRLRNLGRFSESASEVVYLILLLLLAKGYTITRGRLRLASSIKLTIFMCVYVVTYIILFVYERLFFDPGEVLYIYESPAGYGLVTLRIIAWWMFLYATIFTLKHYPEKATFYYPFNLIGTMWFVAGPAFIIAANNLIDKWVRESVVCAVQHFIALSGHILFLVLTVPNKANKNFPYHVRTTQIGIMELGNGLAGNSSLDHFGHHPYAPGGPMLPNIDPLWPRVPVELFTITSTIHTESASLAVPLPRRSRLARRRSAYTPEHLVVHPEEISATDYTSLDVTALEDRNDIAPPRGDIVPSIVDIIPGPCDILPSPPPAHPPVSKSTNIITPGSLSPIEPATDPSIRANGSTDVDHQEDTQGSRPTPPPKAVGFKEVRFSEDEVVPSKEKAL